MLRICLVLNKHGLLQCSSEFNAGRMETFDIPQFKFKQLPPNQVRDEWIRYKRQFEFLVLANNITNKMKLKHIFLARAGPDVQEVYSSTPGANVEEGIGVDPYKVLLVKLEDYFAPKQHEAYQRFLFWSLKPVDQEETIDKFLLRAMDMSSKCNFGNTKQEAQEISVIDKIIQTSHPKLQVRLLQQEHLNLDSLNKTVQSHKSVKFQTGQVSGTALRNESRW